MNIKTTISCYQIFFFFTAHIACRCHVSLKSPMWSTISVIVFVTILRRRSCCCTYGCQFQRQSSQLSTLYKFVPSYWSVESSAVKHETPLPLILPAGLRMEPVRTCPMCISPLVVHYARFSIHYTLCLKARMHRYQS